MATETGSVESFGQVSRRLDRSFRLLLLAATLVGIVMLAVLLVYVANDAVQPLTADPGWLMTYTLSLVAPTLLTGTWLGYRRFPAMVAGVGVLGTATVGVLFGAGVAMVFVDIVPPIRWLAYGLALAIPFGATIALQRLDHRVPYLARVALIVAVLGGSVAVIPPTVAGLRVVPTDSTIVLLTVSMPVAAALGLRAAAGHDSRRIGVAYGAGALAVPSIAMLAGPGMGVDPMPAVVLATVAGLPTIAAVERVRRRPFSRIGLLLPVVVLSGGLVGWAVVTTAGFAGPETWVDWQFLTSPHSGTPSEAGFYPAIGGSIILMVVVAVISFPLGVGSAIYLEEYAPDNRLTRIVDVNIANLAGVPSVVYGLLGLGVFVTYLGQPPGTALVGGATLALLILPIVIIASREAIRSVPDSLRLASDGLGATRWQTVRNVVLPRAFPGILTGTILALGRAIGETAPLIMIGAPNVFYSLPTDLSGKVGAMPLQIYAWASLFAGDAFYTRVVPAGVVTLLVVLLTMNSLAIALRNNYQSRG